MNRKRFIKLLMSYGYARNDALRMSDLSKTPYSSYLQYYNSLSLALCFRSIGISFHEFSKQIQRVAKNLSLVFNYF